MKTYLLLYPVWAGLLLPLGVSAVENGCQNRERVDVALIGTGWAAVSAALTIQKYNEANWDNRVEYVMIERSSTVGGRDKAAHWMHGGRQVPLGDLLQEYAPHLWPSIIEDQHWADMKHWFCDKQVCSSSKEEGKQVDFKPVWRDFFLAYEDCLVPACLAFQAAGGSNNDDIRRALEDSSCGWANPDFTAGSLKTNIEAFEIMEYFPNPKLDLSGVSMWSIPERMWYEHKDSDLFISDPRNFNLLLQEVVSGGGLEEHIMTSYDVELIEAIGDWNEAEGVKLHLRSMDDANDYCTITADKVVSTMSVGVLLNRGGTLFEPTLDIKFESLAKVLEMGTKYTELIFQFGRIPDEYCPEKSKFPENECPWEWKPFDDSYQHIFVETDDSFPSDGPFVAGIYQVLDTAWEGEFYDGSRALYCTVIGDVPETDLDIWANDILDNTLGLVEDYQVQHYSPCEQGDPYTDDWDITNKDDTQFPGSGECKFFIHNKDNPSWGGVWPNWKVGSTFSEIEDFEEEFEPFPEQEPVMYFAGDGFCRRYYGHQSGAITSGMKTGETLLEDLGKTPVDYFPYTCDVDYR